MKKLSGLVVTIMLGLTVSAQTNLDFVPLKEIFKNDFLIGVAVSGRTITGDAGNMVIGNFNTITCENEMKPQSLLYFSQRPAGSPQGQNIQQRQAGAPQGSQQRQPPGRTNATRYGRIPTGAFKTRYNQRISIQLDISRPYC